MELIDFSFGSKSNFGKVQIEDTIPGLLVGEHVLEVLAHLVEKLVVDVLLLVGGLVAVVGGEDLVRGQNLVINK